jgi:hypothetical protein
MFFTKLKKSAADNDGVENEEDVFQSSQPVPDIEDQVVGGRKVLGLKNVSVSHKRKRDESDESGREDLVSFRPV